MSKPPIDELYLSWLYAQVGSVEETNPSRTYWRMLKQLFTKEFVWIIPNDDNRAEDGKQLRVEFLENEHIHSVNGGWLELGCSMLELLIGVSRRLAFEAEGEPVAWFWQLMENLGLEKYNDNFHFADEDVDEILNQVIWRTYKRNGDGGLFPLRRAAGDQRDVEIWYQLNAYVLERT